MVGNVLAERDTRVVVHGFLQFYVTQKASGILYPVVKHIHLHKLLLLSLQICHESFGTFCRSLAIEKVKYPQVLHFEVSYHPVQKFASLVRYLLRH
jgi:hypothetical protein